VTVAPLRYTLLAEGSSDQALIPILTWALRQVSSRPIEAQWPNFERLPTKPKGLADRIRKAIELYPCDLLFVHRDADSSPPELRHREITVELAAALADQQAVPSVQVVPVRMTEAWLLFDQAAIRSAAGNPAGRMPLGLPSLARTESEPDPKARLNSALRTASGQSGRRLAAFNMAGAQRRVAALIVDFAPLRQLPAFQRFEHDLARARI
jgi:hypothetical protein